MADAPKTQPTDEDPVAYCAALPTARRREESARLLELFGEVTGERPVMWGPSIIGFGSYHYVYASGREGDWPLTGVSPRKGALTIYIMAGFPRYQDLMERLGKHRTGKSCLYINKLDDVDLDVLRELVRRSVEHMRA